MCACVPAPRCPESTLAVLYLRCVSLGSTASPLCSTVCRYHVASHAMPAVCFCVCVRVADPFTAHGIGCTNCGSGQYSSGGHSSCTSCSAGQYQGSSGHSSCTNCPSGQYQGSTRSTSCIHCPGGQFQSHSGRSSCIACPSGQSSSGTSCAQCSSGQYQPHSGHASCIGCASGQYQSAHGQTSCTACVSVQCFPVSVFRCVSTGADCLPTKAVAIADNGPVPRKHWTDSLQQLRVWPNSKLRPYCV